MNDKRNSITLIYQFDDMVKLTCTYVDIMMSILYRRGEGVNECNPETIWVYER